MEFLDVLRGIYGNEMLSDAEVISHQLLSKAGFIKCDRKYLETLIRVCLGGPTGIESIAATMNSSSDTLEDDVEPYLLRSELIVRTSRGRVATPKAYEHLKYEPPEAPQGHLFN